MARPKNVRKTKKKAATPGAAPKQPVCACGKVLDWRDRAYGKSGQCKRCTQRAERIRARGTFISAMSYITQLEVRQQWKRRPYHQTAIRDLPARMRALKAGK